MSRQNDSFDDVWRKKASAPYENAKGEGLILNPSPICLPRLPVQSAGSLAACIRELHQILDACPEKFIPGQFLD